MTTEQKERIAVLRKAGKGYTAIARELGLPKGTVSTYCHRHDLSPCGQNAETHHVCQTCGVEIIQLPGRKEKKFCSDACRNKWWNSHLADVNRKAMYDYTCPQCGTHFRAYGNRNRKYCSHACYIADRFGGSQCG